MQYKVKIGEEEREVFVKKQEGGLLLVEIGEKTYSVRASRLPDKRISAVVDGLRHTFAVQSDAAEKTVFHQGVQYTLQDASRRRGRGGSGDNAHVTPPMPGVIVRILVEEGQTVTKNQELLVMSAMKMETTLYAPRDAVVQKILVKEGDQVNAGQNLVDFAEIAKEDGEGSAA
ncbi:MAG: hypothetical protein H6728_08855 [Myxococcales bacterium]|nr:hypothetical protein [Myxococcales bacterium]